MLYTKTKSTLKSFSILLLLLLSSTFLFAQEGSILDAKRKKGQRTSTVDLTNLIKAPSSKSLKAKSNTKTYTISPLASNFLQPITLQRIHQNAEIAKLRMVDAKAKVVWDETQSTPVFITGENLYPKSKIQAKKASQADVAKAFLTENAQLLQIKDPATEFQIKKTEKDDLGYTHIRMDQYYKGIKVWGSDVIVHLHQEGVEGFNGRYYATPKEVKTNPSISAETAFTKVEEHFELHPELAKHAMMHGHHGHDHSAEEVQAHQAAIEEYKYILNVDLPEPQLLFLPSEDGKKMDLVWHVNYMPDLVHRYEYFIDAQSGEVLKSLYATCTLVGKEVGRGTDLNGQSRTLNLYKEDNFYFMIDATRPMYNASKSSIPHDPVGAILTLDLFNNPLSRLQSDLSHSISQDKNDWRGKEANVSAHFNAGLCYEYFKNTFGRESLDGIGGTINSIVNISESDGSSMENAFWNGYFMGYGNGGTAFEPLAGALDVAGHEMSHGVIQNTANLVYQFQPGALNESFADVFGVMLDREDWKLGEDIVNRTYFSSGALRDMQNPNNGESTGHYAWQPKHMNEYQRMASNEDNGGVHVNSGIPNRAFYNFATNSAVGKDRAEQVYYRALASYLTQSSKFVDCRLAVVKAANDLYGGTVADAARKAFSDVGIFADDEVVDNPDTGTGSPTELPPVVGDERMIVHEASNASNVTMLYDYDVANNNLTPLTNRRSISKPSISEDGKWAAFIGSDFNIYDVNLENQGVDRLTDSGDLTNVAYSPDGNKIAYVSQFDDTPYVYVYNFATQEGAQFVLENPTTADGIKGDTPVYADQIDWDNEGEYVMYDAYNLVSDFGLSGGGDNSLDYWDIGVIKVWDNATNGYGDGTIFKLFQSLPAGVSIGNPSFSSNASHIICFDYIDTNDGTVAILMANLENGKVGTVLESNNMLGYPHFGPDDNLITYNTGVNGDTIVRAIPVSTSSLSSTGSAQDVFTEAKWLLWYKRGARAFQKPAANFVSNVTNGSAPITVDYYDRSSNSPNQWSWSFPGGNPSSSTEQNPSVYYNSPGRYNVTLRATNPAGSDTETKNGYLDLFAVGLEEDLINTHISVFPNPNEGVFFVEIGTEIVADYSVQVFNTLGQMIVSDQRKQTNNYSEQLDLRAYPVGMYLVKVNIDDEQRVYRIQTIR